MESMAKAEQVLAMEQDEREGVVGDYLEMPLPENWNRMDLYQRREYFHNREEPGWPKGTKKRTTVSNMEIWCECLGKNKEDLRPSDSYNISSIIIKIPGWEKTTVRKTLLLYGQQRIYVRKKR